MKKHYYLFFLLTLLGKLGFGQTERFEAAVKNALNERQFFTNDDFFGVSTLDSLNLEDQFQFSEVARRMHAIGLAEAGYRRVVRMDTMKGNIKYPTALFHAGKMKKLQGDYAGALIYFEKYISSPPPIDNDYLQEAKKDIEDCQFAIPRTKQIDQQYRVSHLDTNINTPFNDFSPLLVGENLYFASLKHQKNENRKPPRLFAKTMVTDLHSKASPLAGFNQKEQSVAHLAFTADQQRAYFTICDYVGKSRKIRCKLYYQDKISEGKWSKPQVLPNHINRKGFTATHPTVAYDDEGKELLLFSSDCPGGRGKMDVWMTEITGNNQFSTPENFSPINSEGNDLTPFFHQPTNTVYFSSDGRTGLGGYDIYRLRNGDITHMGYPLNSSFNDTHFTLDPTGDQGYFSSSRQGCLRLSEYDMGCQDIFGVQFINIDLEALTFDAFTQKELEGVTLELYRLPGRRMLNPAVPKENLLVDSRTNTLDHYFQFDELVKDVPYQLVASKAGYISDTLTFNTRGITESITLKKQLFLAPDIFEMDLTALTFDATTQEPLTNCIVQLIDVERGDRIITDNITGNDFYFDIYSQREYRLIASLIGYVTDTLDFNTNEFTEPTGLTSLTKRLNLEPGGLVELGDLLPLTLYFDNDAPDPKSRGITTTYNYENLYAAYYRKKREFVANYTANITGDELSEKTAAITHFFDQELKGNYDTLGVFSETLIKYLQRGNTAVISIRGFASPLAGKDYNINLGKRRVNCLMNHFASYRDGMLNRYIENGNLRLQEVSFGEARAAEDISENPKDRQNSVYSPEASRERKVQIVEITIGTKTQGE
ncbi:MAG: hypothetical protein AAF960_16740 [Bacteroidota bacterium]